MLFIILEPAHSNPKFYDSIVNTCGKTINTHTDKHIRGCISLLLRDEIFYEQNKENDRVKIDIMKSQNHKKIILKRINIVFVAVESLFYYYYYFYLRSRVFNIFNKYEIKSIKI